MTGTDRGMNWGARLLIALLLLLAGAAAATWGLAHYRSAARILGVIPPPPQIVASPPALSGTEPAASPPAQAPATDPRIADIESRLGRVEAETAQAQGSAGRADALVIAFAARRAIDRGVALGYLESLLVSRFGAQHQAAVATIITTARQPVTLDDLTAAYDSLGPDLRRGGPQDSWWTNMRRELGELVEVHRADAPPSSVDARYELARQRLARGDVDRALAETMRLPGASRAAPWVEKARRYVAAHRALDEIESAALLPSANSPA